MELSLESISDVFYGTLHMFKRWRFGNKAQHAFLEDLYLLINDGIPANRAIEMMTQISTGLNKEVAISLTTKIAQGKPLAEGMHEWFSPNVIEIIRVGEAGGALAQTLKSATNMLSQRGVAVGSFVGAVLYPLTVIIMACGLMIYLDSSIFTQFRAIKPESQWPESGRQLVSLTYFVTHYWWAVIVGVIIFALIMRYIMINYTGELRPHLDRFPPFNFYKRFASGRLLETLGLLVSNGVVFKSALRVIQHQATPYLSTHLVMMEHLLSMGKTNIAEVLDTGLIDKKDLMRLRVMAEVKGFEHGLIRMGMRGTEEATATLKLLAKILGGVLLAVGGYLIIMIVRGIYLTGMTMGTQ